MLCQPCAGTGTASYAELVIVGRQDCKPQARPADVIVLASAAREFFRTGGSRLSSFRWNRNLAAT